MRLHKKKVVPSRFNIGKWVWANEENAMLKLEQFEKGLDENLEKVLKNPLFLQAVGTALNLNSYRKAWMNQALTSGWKLLQLPNKRDQERTLHLINELHHRIAELEAKLDESRETAIESDAKTESRIPRKKKTLNGSELRSIQ
jgi:hypothetical protein